MNGLVAFVSAMLAMCTVGFAQSGVDKTQG
jgi:hypothetical protein